MESNRRFMLFNRVASLNKHFQSPSAFKLPVSSNCASDSVPVLALEAPINKKGKFDEKITNYASFECFWPAT